MTNKLLEKKIANKTFKNLLVYTPVRRGGFFNIPAGLIHGIGEGITVFEVQQPSDVTYRYYDYDRLENGVPRELHIDKAIKVQKDLSYKLSPKWVSPLTYENAVGTQTFLSSPSILEEDSIVVDFDNQCAYLANKGEKIELKNYCVVSI